MFFADELENVAYFFWTFGELDSDLVTGGCWSSWGIGYAFFGIVHSGLSFLVQQYLLVGPNSSYTRKRELAMLGCIRTYSYFMYRF